MTKYDLKFPIDVDGKTVSSVTIRRAKGRDMVAIGDHVATLARFYAENAKVIRDEMKKAAKAGFDAAQAGDAAQTEAVSEDEMAASLTPPDAKVYGAMVAIAARLADLGDAAGDLDLVDLQEIAARALNPGEAEGRGEAKTGAA